MKSHRARLSRRLLAPAVCGIASGIAQAQSVPPPQRIVETSRADLRYDYRF